MKRKCNGTPCMKCKNQIMYYDIEGNRFPSGFCSAKILQWAWSPELGCERPAEYSKCSDINVRGKPCPYFEEKLTLMNAFRRF